MGQGDELRRISLPRTRVNKGNRKGRSKNDRSSRGFSALANSIPQRWRPRSSPRPLPLRQGVRDATTCAGQNFLYRLHRMASSSLAGEASTGVTGACMLPLLPCEVAYL